MLSRTIELNTAAMVNGGDLSQFAGQAAARAAARLAQSALPSSIFGDFDTAHAYHRSVTTAHGTHVERLEGHRTSLTDISGKAFSGATAFDTADDDGAGRIESAAGLVTAMGL